MDWLNKQKTYVWTIVILVILNLTSIILLWTVHPRFPPMDKNGRPDINNFLKKELGLNNDQEKSFNSLRQSLHDSMDVINKQIWERKSEIQDQAFQDNPDTLKVNKLLEEVVNYQIQSEKLMFNHFSDLRKVFSKQQMVKFNNILNRHDRNDPLQNGRNQHFTPPSPGEFPPPGM